MPEEKNTGQLIKIVIGFALLLAAVGLAISTYKKMNPPLKPEPPQSSLMLRKQKQEIHDGFRMGLETLNLTEEQEKQFKEWQAWSPKGKSREEKREHQKQLAEILDEEQLERYRQLVRIRRDENRELNSERREKMERLLGEKDLKKHRENVQKIHEQRKQRIEEQKQYGETD
jgi:Spy/CpxP family protein refolding chaperone